MSQWRPGNEQDVGFLSAVMNFMDPHGPPSQTPCPRDTAGQRLKKSPGFHATISTSSAPTETNTRGEEGRQPWRTSPPPTTSPPPSTHNDLQQLWEEWQVRQGQRSPEVEPGQRSHVSASHDGGEFGGRPGVGDGGCGTLGVMDVDRDVGPVSQRSGSTSLHRGSRKSPGRGLPAAWSGPSDQVRTGGLDCVPGLRPTSVSGDRPSPVIPLSKSAGRWGGHSTWDYRPWSAHSSPGDPGMSGCLSRCCPPSKLSRRSVCGDVSKSCQSSTAGCQWESVRGAVCVDHPSREGEQSGQSGRTVPSEWVGLSHSDSPSGSSERWSGSSHHPRTLSPSGSVGPAERGSQSRYKDHRGSVSPAVSGKSPHLDGHLWSSSSPSGPVVGSAGHARPRAWSGEVYRESDASSPAFTTTTHTAGEGEEGSGGGCSKQWDDLLSYVGVNWALLDVVMKGAPRQDAHKNNCQQQQRPPPPPPPPLQSPPGNNRHRGASETSPSIGQSSSFSEGSFTERRVRNMKNVGSREESQRQARSQQHHRRKGASLDRKEAEHRGEDPRPGQRRRSPPRRLAVGEHRDRRGNADHTRHRHRTSSQEDDDHHEEKSSRNSVGDGQPEWCSRGRDSQPEWNSRNSVSEGHSEWDSRNNDSEGHPEWNSRNDGEGHPERNSRNSDSQLERNSRNSISEGHPEWNSRNSDSEGHPEWHSRNGVSDSGCVERGSHPHEADREHRQREQLRVQTDGSREQGNPEKCGKTSTDHHRHGKDDDNESHSEEERDGSASSTEARHHFVSSREQENSKVERNSRKGERDGKRRKSCGLKTERDGKRESGSRARDSSQRKQPEGSRQLETSPVGKRNGGDEVDSVIWPRRGSSHRPHSPLHTPHSHRKRRGTVESTHRKRHGTVESTHRKCRGESTHRKRHGTEESTSRKRRGRGESTRRKRHGTGESTHRKRHGTGESTRRKRHGNRDRSADSKPAEQKEEKNSDGSPRKPLKEEEDDDDPPSSFIVTKGTLVVASKWDSPTHPGQCSSLPGSNGCGSKVSPASLHTASEAVGAGEGEEKSGEGQEGEEGRWWQLSEGGWGDAGSAVGMMDASEDQHSGENTAGQWTGDSGWTGSCGGDVCTDHAQEDPDHTDADTDRETAELGGASASLHAAEGAEVEPLLQGMSVPELERTLVRYLMLGFSSARQEDGGESGKEESPLPPSEESRDCVNRHRQGMDSALKRKGSVDAYCGGGSSHSHSPWEKSVGCEKREEARGESNAQHKHHCGGSFTTQLHRLCGVVNIEETSTSSSRVEHTEYHGHEQPVFLSATGGLGRREQRDKKRDVAADDIGPREKASSLPEGLMSKSEGLLSKAEGLRSKAVVTYSDSSSDSGTSDTEDRSAPASWTLVPQHTMSSSAARKRRTPAQQEGQEDSLQRKGKPTDGSTTMKKKKRTRRRQSGSSSDSSSGGGLQQELLLLQSLGEGRKKTWQLRSGHRKQEGKPSGQEGERQAVMPVTTWKQFMRRAHTVSRRWGGRGASGANRLSAPSDKPHT